MSGFTHSGSLENHFLIAMPHLQDPIFAHSVTYLWKHTHNGALGLVINKPLTASVADILAELDIDLPADARPLRHKKVMAGGPVERDKGFILHDSSRTWDSSISLTETLSLCTSRQILEAIAVGEGPDRYLVALGCAGWDAGQLEREISENAWLTIPADPTLIFSEDHTHKAAAAAALLGIDLTQLATAVGHA